MDHPDRHDHGGDVIQHLRRAAAARVRSRPLRHVARQTGMSPAGLKNFLGSCSFGSAIARVKVAENVDEPTALKLREAALTISDARDGVELHSKAMKLRSVPQLHFHYDESISRGAHLSALIERAVAEDSKHRDD